MLPFICFHFHSYRTAGCYQRPAAYRFCTSWVILTDSVKNCKTIFSESPQKPVLLTCFGHVDFLTLVWLLNFLQMISWFYNMEGTSWYDPSRFPHHCEWRQPQNMAHIPYSGYGSKPVWKCQNADSIHLFPPGPHWFSLKSAGFLRETALPGEKDASIQHSSNF